MSETKLNFVDIQRFLLNDMKLQANYQPIMIRTLLTSPENTATKDEIAKNIKELNLIGMIITSKIYQCMRY